MALGLRLKDTHMGKQEYDINSHLLSPLPDINPLLKNDVMKFAIAFVFLIAIPLVLLAMLLTFIIPLFMQRLFKRRQAESTVFPYLTSWEEEAAA